MAEDSTKYTFLGGQEIDRIDPQPQPQPRQDQVYTSEEVRDGTAPKPQGPQRVIVPVMVTNTDGRPVSLRMQQSRTDSTPVDSSGRIKMPGASAPQPASPAVHPSVHAAPRPDSQSARLAPQPIVRKDIPPAFGGLKPSSVPAETDSTRPEYNLGDTVLTNLGLIREEFAGYGSKIAKILPRRNGNDKKLETGEDMAEVTQGTIGNQLATRFVVEGVKEGDYSTYEDRPVAPWFRPGKRAQDLAVLHDRELAFEDQEHAGARPLDIDRQRRGVLRNTALLAGRALPPAVAESPAARFISEEAAVQAVSHFVAHTDEVEIGITGHALQPNMTILKTNTALRDLSRASMKHGLSKVIMDVPPLEAAQRTAAALSMSDVAKQPLEVVTNSANKDTEVDAWQAAHIVQRESRDGGLVLGRSDAMGSLVRPNGVKEETFTASVGMVQDVDDPGMTLVYALEPGRLPMPGRRSKGSQGNNKEDFPQDWGTLQLSAVAVDAARFALRMSHALNAPVRHDIEDVGVAGMRVVREERRQVDLVQAMKFISDTEAIGVVRPLLHAQTNHNMLSGGNAAGTYSSEFVDGEVMGE